jgi:hypothetical protein
VSLFGLSIPRVRPAATATSKHCLLVEQTSGLDPNEKYTKTFAPEIGLIQDRDLL